LPFSEGARCGAGDDAAVERQHVVLPVEVCVHQLFEAQVDRTPDATALIYRTRSLTYRELDERANAVAAHLRRLGVGPDSMVGIFIDRSIDMMVGLLGTMKAGAVRPDGPRLPVGADRDDARGLWRRGRAHPLDAGRFPARRA
jgi:non-ribosomal peptide synthetase component F